MGLGLLEMGLGSGLEPGIGIWGWDLGWGLAPGAGTLLRIPALRGAVPLWSRASFLQQSLENARREEK